MRLSQLRTALKFFKERDFIFTDPNHTRRFGIKAYILTLAYLIGAGTWIHEFCMLTPDLQFDIMRLSNPDFDKYIESSKLDAFHGYHRANVVSYHFGDSMGKKAMYRDSVTKDMFKGDL